MNKISATGRIVADAEVRFLPKGDALANFRLASDVGFGDNKQTNWFNCAIFGKRGEAIAPHLTKGQQVTVFGTLTMREWINKEGAKQLSPEIRIDEIELQGGKRDSQEPQRTKPGRMAEQPGAGFEGDQDIPF